MSVPPNHYLQTQQLIDPLTWENVPSDMWAERGHKPACASTQWSAFVVRIKKFCIFWLSKICPVKILIRPQMSRLIWIFAGHTWSTFLRPRTAEFYRALFRFHTNIVRKQEAHGPQFAHLITTATAYLQMPCNILPVLQPQLGHRFDHTIKRSKVILVSSF